MSALDPTAIDLFAGAGGLSEGFRQSGFRVTHAVEIDEWAAATFKINHSDTTVVLEGIRKFQTPKSIHELIGTTPDVIIGGPPCQGFSHSNSVNRDPRDPRNSLFRDFLRFVETLRPPVCVIENVKGLLSTCTQEGRQVIAIIHEAFATLGYRSSHRLLNAVNFGVPQYRERLFIAAVRKDLRAELEWPKPTHSPRNLLSEVANRELISELIPDVQRELRPAVLLWEAISDLPQITSSDRDDDLGYSTPPQNEYQRIMRLGAAETIFNHEPMHHTQRIVERFKRIGYGESETDVDPALAPRQRGGNGRGSPYHQNSRRQRPDRPCNTIVASSHTNFIHPYLHRNFTVRELARIQSFHDRYVFRGKRAVLSRKLSARKGLVEDLHLDQMGQVGNAVPPLLALVLGKSVLRTLSPLLLHSR